MASWFGGVLKTAEGFLESLDSAAAQTLNTDDV